MSKIISGHIAEDGRIVSGTGDFKASGISERGECTVTFTEPFTTYVNVVITTNPEFSPALAYLIASSTSEFKVQLLDVQGGGVEVGISSFHFIAVGE